MGGGVGTGGGAEHFEGVREEHFEEHFVETADCETEGVREKHLGDEDFEKAGTCATTEGAGEGDATRTAPTGREQPRGPAPPRPSLRNRAGRQEPQEAAWRLR